MTTTISSLPIQAQSGLEQTTATPALTDYVLWFPSDGSHAKKTTVSAVLSLITDTGMTQLTGDVTASGSGSVATTLAMVNSNVGSFGDSTHIPVVTVDAKGRATAVSTVVVSSITQLTGDVTASGSGSVATTLATVNSTVGSFGDGSHVPVVTVDAKGRVTAVSTAAVAGGGGSMNILNPVNFNLGSCFPGYWIYDAFNTNQINSYAYSCTIYAIPCQQRGTINSLDVYLKFVTGCSSMPAGIAISVTCMSSFGAHPDYVGTAVTNGTSTLTIHIVLGVPFTFDQGYRLNFSIPSAGSPLGGNSWTLLGIVANP